MRFVLFTDKTIPQCAAALNERLQAPHSSSRPGLDGYVEKNGKFSLAITSNVIGRLTRKTRLDAQIERENGNTVIRGSVSDGAGPQGQILVIIGMILIAGLIYMQTKGPVQAVIVLLAGGIVYVPLRGDFENSDRLLIEVEKTLKASPKPPKPSTKRTTTTAKVVTSGPRGATAKKPTATVKKSASTAARKPSLPKPILPKSTATAPAKSRS